MPQTVYVERREWEQRLKALGANAEAGTGESVGKTRYASKANGDNDDEHAQHGDDDGESEGNDEDYEVENDRDNEEDDEAYSEEEEEEDAEEDVDEEENEYEEYEEYEEDQHKDWQFWPVTSAATLVEKVRLVLYGFSASSYDVSQFL